MHICTVIKEKIRSLLTERNKYVLKRYLDDDSDGTHLTSFGIEFMTEEAKDDERVASAVKLCVGRLRRGTVCELEGVFRECDFPQHISGI